jgi:hypothetical protein
MMRTDRMRVLMPQIVRVVREPAIGMAGNARTWLVVGHLAALQRRRMPPIRNLNFTEKLS